MDDKISRAANFFFWDCVVLCSEKCLGDMLITGEKDKDAKCKVTDSNVLMALKSQLVWCYVPGTGGSTKRPGALDDLDVLYFLSKYNTSASKHHDATVMPLALSW